MAESDMRLHHQLAMGKNPTVSSPTSRKTGYAKGGHVAHKAGHHNMDGHIGGHHHHTHKSHGHHVSSGVHHHKTGSAFSGSGESIKSDHRGPSSNQFGSHMPHGGTLGKW